MRIGIAGISCECCTCSPLPNGRSDFLLLEGETLLGEYPFLSEYTEFEFIPLLRARALPGGSVDPDFYAEFKAEMLERLSREEVIDGLLLHMHGALHVAGMDDAEADLYSSIREAVGSDCVISASYDLHGNLSQAAAVELDMLSAYRTAPHVDVQETVRRAFDLLVRSLREGVRPARQFISVPILLPGEQTSTEWEPGLGLYAAIPEIVEGHGLWDASLLIGYLWADEPRAGASVVAYGPDEGATRSAAELLAQRLWDSRHEFAFGMAAHPVDECICIATNSQDRPVIISDSGDNPTAGGAGDLPHLLERLLALNAENALLAGITDAAAVDLCHEAERGDVLDLALGGQLDPVHSAPLPITAELRSLHDVPWSVGTSSGRTQRAAVLRAGGVDILVTERRTPFHRLIDIERFGIDPHEYQIIVVKIGYLEPELKELAALSLLALSPGAVDQDTDRLDFKRLRRPIYPLDPDMDWSPSLDPR